jgi:hypothetical protein
MSFPYTLRFNGGNKHFNEILHLWFDFLSFPPPKGKTNWKALGGSFTRETEEAVKKFQLSKGLPLQGKKLGEVTSVEWMYLGREVGYKAWDPANYECLYKGNCVSLTETMRFLKQIGGYGGNSLSGGINIHGPTFLEMYAEEFGGIEGSTLRGLGQFLEFMRTDKNLTDVRHVAYMMATVYKEASQTWQAIDEKGKGAGKRYGLVRVGKCGGNEYKRIYYGRGYIQITWEDNYQFVDDYFGLNCSLVSNPERAKEAELAYKIASYGMREGWFEKPHHYKLSDFIIGNNCDYVEARRIINPNESIVVFKEIAGYAKVFEAMLRATMFR